MIRLYRSDDGPVMERDGRLHDLTDRAWDDLLAREDLPSLLQSIEGEGRPLEGIDAIPDLLPPIASQEVWACGVTYRRSRQARLQESGGVDHYARVYEAARPEIFFKATPHRVAGHRQPVRIRADSRWSVPEPELTLVIASTGRIVGYTIGNDMSARDIEGDNPLYLPQAKIYDGCCALGPGILVTDELLPAETAIHLEIRREGEVVEKGSTSLEKLHRDPRELADWLTRECSFPAGVFLLTGTGVVPSDRFTLAPGDEIAISIDSIGTLINVVA